MTILFELATLTIGYGAQASCGTAIQDFTTMAGAKGDLLGCWSSDIGTLNRLAILRRFSSREDLAVERQRTLLSSNPFGCADWLEGMSIESYECFPGIPALEPGRYGQIYEFRTYTFKTGGLSPTLEAWRAAIPARTKLSPLVLVMYAVDGPPRFTHIWPYESLDARAAIRGEAVRKGIWPPPAAPSWLTANLNSTIYLPMTISPLQ